MAKELSIIEAYTAMFRYWEKHYNRTKSDAIGSILGDLQLLPDGMPTDPAAWDDWQDAVKEALTGNLPYMKLTR